MTKLSFLLAFISITSFAFGEVWYEGAIVLKDGHVKRGELIVQSAFDVVVFRTNEEVTVYPAHKVRSAFFYDHISDINRRFLSVVQNLRGYGIGTYQLYEVVVQGEIPVIRRYKGFLFDEHSDADSYVYSILYNDEVISLRQFRRRVYPDLLDFDQPTIRAYMLSEQLNPSKQADAIRLIEFFNNLVKSPVTHMAQIR